MKIKVTTNFAHAPSRRGFIQDREYDVLDANGLEFVKAGLAVEVKPVEVKEVKPEPKKESK